MKDLYKSCILCPRNCAVDRLSGEVGFCGETAQLRIGAAVIHKGEEPPLVGQGGSGTIFVSGCNLGCSFCQNYQISQGNQVSQDSYNAENAESGINGGGRLGKAVSPDKFAKICIALSEKGAENINIVTGSHAIPGLMEGINKARKCGVSLPVLWNSSGYDSPEALELLSDYVDIFLPDLKTLDSQIAKNFFNAPDYPKAAEAAILKMIEIIERKTVHNPKEKIIIRHLILPGYLDSTHSVLKWFAKNVKDRAMLSLMTQYTPVLRSPPPNRQRPMPERFVSKEEYETVLYWLQELKIEEGFCQELVTGNDWLPDFNRSNPFPSELSVPVWSLQK